MVCVQCVGGRDRTGLISALAMRLAGVSVADIGRDYAESETRLAKSHARWVAKAPDEQERAYRLVFAHEVEDKPAMPKDRPLTGGLKR